MDLKDYLNSKGKTPSRWARDHHFPISVITRLINGQRSVSLKTAARIVAATNGEVGFADLLPQGGNSDGRGLDEAAPEEATG